MDFENIFNESVNKIEQCKVVFFASGDFPYPTLKQLLDLKLYNIVGIVTSKYKSESIGHTITDLAVENNIPYITIYNDEELKTEQVRQWLIEKNADIFCVISFKYLPKSILEIPRITSFNIHASLLPFLRGAAPIHWAIRYGFKYTGLTSFVLDEKIDTGEIITNLRMPINGDDNYGTLFKRLSYACIGLTVETISLLYNHDDWRRYTTLQSDCGLDWFRLMKAPKLDIYNTTITTGYEDGDQYFNMDELYDTIRSLSPNIGCHVEMIVRKLNEETSSYVIKDVIKLKIFDAEFITNLNYKKISEYYSISSNIITDGKTFMCIVNRNLNKMISIKEIQQAGKKKLSIKDFLAGFQYGRTENTILCLR